MALLYLPPGTTRFSWFSAGFQQQGNRSSDTGIRLPLANDPCAENGSTAAARSARRHAGAAAFRGGPAFRHDGNREAGYLRAFERPGGRRYHRRQSRDQNRGPAPQPRRGLKCQFSGVAHLPKGRPRSLRSLSMADDSGIRALRNGPDSLSGAAIPFRFEVTWRSLAAPLHPSGAAVALVSEP